MSRFLRGFTAATAARIRKQSMGDDLTAARRFCNTVRSDMSTLIDGVCAQPCAAPDVLIGSLDSIQSGAKQLKARSIFRAAQTVVNAVNDRAPLPTLQGRVLSLNKLICQYEGGLNDIAPRPANGALAYDNQFDPLPTGKTDLDARYKAARDALAPIIGLSRKGPERDNLFSLANFSNAELAAQMETPEKPPEKLAADLPSDIVLESLFDENVGIDMPTSLLSEAAGPSETALLETKMSGTALSKFTPEPIFTQPAAMQSIREIDFARQIDFETLMPDFISQALQEARQTDKTVSVSYAADGVSLDHKQLTAFQALFDHIAKTLVGSVLERPETRRRRGASGAGHIAITATQSSTKISISIECPGTALAVSAYMPTGQSVEGLIITPGGNAKEGHAHIVLTAPRRKRAVPSASSSGTASAEMAS